MIILGAQNSELKGPDRELLHKRKHSNREAISGMKQNDFTVIFHLYF